MYILNTLEFDRDYTSLSVSIKRLIPISHFGLPEEFYGGRVTMIGEIKDSPILLLIDNHTDGLQVVDIAVKDLNDISFDVLKQYAKTKNIDFDWRKITKEELIDKIKPRLPVAA